jgi:hypothetical protein
MHSSRPLRDGSSPAALPALLHASHLFGLALGSALGKLRESGATAARLFERAEESALLLRMTRERPTDPVDARTQGYRFSDFFGCLGVFTATGVLEPGTMSCG